MPEITRYPCEYTKKIVCSNYTAIVTIKANNEKTIDTIIQAIREGEWL